MTAIPRENGMEVRQAPSAVTGDSMGDIFQPNFLPVKASFLGEKS